MKAFTTLVALSAAGLALAQEALFINTPISAVQCLPSLIGFGGGSAPYYISVLPAGQVAAVPIEYFPEQPVASNYTWVVDLPAGTNFSLSIRDSTGVLNYAAPVVVQASNNATCVNATASSVAVSEGALTATATATASSDASATTAAGIRRNVVRLF